ncbi:hypothetical protein Bca52824_047657 [Brassica carinata]|uniref:Uncharacterized protein n=1 Tax=Brassica carinata TaxID=52824 RepID=A0A8X7RF28_BRACI|nr:hypothetical protein Bca52824_047657 [Brassica carinata]
MIVNHLLRSIDECDDLEVECSSQESSDTEISDDEQSIVQEPLKEDQTERVSFLAALFKKNFSEVKKPVKPKVKAVSSSEYGPDVTNQTAPNSSAGNSATATSAAASSVAANSVAANSALGNSAIETGGNILKETVEIKKNKIKDFFDCR